MEDTEIHISSDEPQSIPPFGEYCLVATKVHNGIVLQYDLLPKEKALEVSARVLDEMLGRE